MSGLRDRRVRVYTYSNTAEQGLVSARYTFRAEYWATLSELRGRKQQLGDAPNTKVDGVLDFDAQLTINDNDLFIVDGTLKFFARGSVVNHARMSRLVNVERIAEEVFTGLDVDGWSDPDDATYSTSIVES